MDRRPYNEWQERRDGSPEFALTWARQILETHEPEPLDPKLSAELGRIITAAEKQHIRI
jgi:trimethylamine:corrinoid methyltransferase-like protein